MSHTLLFSSDPLTSQKKHTNCLLSTHSSKVVNYYRVLLAERSTMSLYTEHNLSSDWTEWIHLELSCYSHQMGKVLMGMFMLIFT